MQSKKHTTAGKTWLICPVSSKTITDVDMVRVTLPDNAAAPEKYKQVVIYKRLIIIFTIE